MARKEKVTEPVKEEEEVASEETPRTGQLDPEFMAGIDEAIDKQIAETSETKEPESPEDTPDDESGDDAEDEAEDDGDESPAIDDALLERAIRAGLTMSAAKAVTSNDALANIVSRLEAKAEADAKEKEEEKATDADLMASIPDLDPEEYPEDIVNSFAAMKKVIADQIVMIGELKNNASPQGTWVDMEIAGKGKAFEDVFGKGLHKDLTDDKHKAARDKLLRHIEVAREDAKTDGKELSNTEAFDRAMTTAFGDKVKTEKAKATKSAAASRAAKATNRPRTTTGRFAPSDDYGDGDDREAEAIAAVAEIMAK